MCRSEQGEYLLARDLNAMSLEALKDLFPWPIPKPSTPNEGTADWVYEFDQRLLQVRQAQANVLDIPIQRLFHERQS
jgi:hypothetical protein